MKNYIPLQLLVIITACIITNMLEARSNKKTRNKKTALNNALPEVKVVAPPKVDTQEIIEHCVKAIKNVEEFETIKKETPLLFVDFWADYCGVCKMMKPDIKKLSVEYKDKVTFVQVDVGQNHLIPLGKKYAPTALPTFLLIIKGEIHTTLTGSQCKEGIAIFLDKMIKQAEKQGISTQPTEVLCEPKTAVEVKTAKAQPITFTIETTQEQTAEVVKTGKTTAIKLKAKS